MGVLHTASYDIKTVLVNFTVLLYFVVLAIVNQVSVGVLYWTFYAALVMCSVIGMIACGAQTVLKRTLILTSLLLTGILNYFFVRNSTAHSLMFLVVYFYASFAFESKRVNEITPLIAIFVNAAIIGFRFMTVGLYGQLFTNASNNFVSVYLMYPTVVYYSIISRKDLEIKLYPILIVWVLTLLARGRGGIISVTVFLLLIYALKYRSMQKNKKYFVNFFIFLALCAIGMNLDLILSKLSASVVMEQFEQRGGLTSSRFVFWEEYLRKTLSNKREVLLGTDVSNMIIGRALGKNPHNSFLEVHMTNGVLGFLIVLSTLGFSFAKGLKRKEYLFLFCMIFVIIRGFTDHVLWNAYGTPVLFFFMFSEGTESKNSTVSFIKRLSVFFAPIKNRVRRLLEP